MVEAVGVALTALHFEAFDSRGTYIFQVCAKGCIWGQVADAFRGSRAPPIAWGYLRSRFLSFAGEAFTSRRYHTGRR